MDKKYNAIKTLKDLDLSRGTRSSIGSGSGKSTFSTQSKEDRYNEAFKNDFKSSPKKEAGMDIKPQKLPPLKPQKLPPLELETKKPLLLKPQKLPPLEDKVIEGKIMNPITGREVSLTYYKSLVKSGKISDTLSQAKSGKIDFFSPPPPLEKPSLSTDYKDFKGNIFSRESWYKVDENMAFLLNKNTPTDPKYKKEQQEKGKGYRDVELLSAYNIIGDMYGKYDDPERLLKAKPVIDKRLKEWEKIKILDSDSSGSPQKNWKDYIKTLPSPRMDKEWRDFFKVSPSYFDSSSPKPATPPKKKSSSPPKSATPPKKTRGRPKGSLNKPKKKSSS